jgi:hypothetical protein
MPGLTRNQKIAKQKRLLTTDNRFRKVDDSFVSQGNAVDERYLNEYIQSLFGDDDWCGPDIVDKNEVDLTDDEVILSEIEADLDNSNEKILERWRESVSRQDDSFLRRVIQHMQDNNGIQKGIRTILRERELRHDGSKLDC